MLRDTIGVDVDVSEGAIGGVEDTISPTEDVAGNDDELASGTDVDELDKGVLESAAVDGKTEDVACEDRLDDTVVVDVDSSEVAIGDVEGGSCTSDDIATRDEEVPSGTDADETVEGKTEVVACEDGFDDKVEVDIDSSEVAIGSVDVESCTSDDVATRNEEVASGTDVDELDKGVLEPATVDGDTEVVACEEALRDTIGVDVDVSEVAIVGVEETISATEDVAGNDDEIASGTDVDELDKGVLEPAAVDGKTEVVACEDGFDATVDVDVDSSEVAIGGVEDGSCPSDDIATRDVEVPSGTDADVTVEGKTEVVACEDGFDDTVVVDVDSSEVAIGSVDVESCTGDDAATRDEELASGTDVDELDKGVLEPATVDGDTEVVACEETLRDTIGVDLDVSEVAIVGVEETISATEDVAGNDDEIASGTDVDELDKGVLEPAAVDGKTEVVACEDGFDATVDVDVDSSEVAIGGVEDGSCTSDDIATRDEEVPSGTDADETVEGKTEVVACEDGFDDTVVVDVDSSEDTI